MYPSLRNGVDRRVDRQGERRRLESEALRMREVRRRARERADALEQLAQRYAREFGLPLQTARAHVEKIAIQFQPRPAGDGFASRSE
jgi:hypothetical protein